MVLLISERFPLKVLQGETSGQMTGRRCVTIMSTPGGGGGGPRAQKAKHSANILLGGGALSPPRTTHPCSCVCVCACARLFVCERVSQVSAKKAGAFQWRRPCTFLSPLLPLRAPHNFLFWLEPWGLGRGSASMQLGIYAINKSLLMTHSSHEYSERRRCGCLMRDVCSFLLRQKSVRPREET